ncbi:MAG: cytochrome P450 [Acidimicrobiia bacterium]
MADTKPVTDWATDFDVLDGGYVRDPFAVWDELRERCPVAHTDRRLSTWLPTRYEDVAAIAHDIDHFSSREVGVIPRGTDDVELPEGLPPISADPPVHTWSRRLLLPWFSHQRVAKYEPMTKALCDSLIDVFESRDYADAAADYAQQIPVRVIASMLGVPGELAETFTGWVRDVLEFADDAERRNRGRAAIVTYFFDEISKRRDSPGDDLISALLHSDVDGQPVSDGHVLGIAALTLIAGVDTTWSAIGASLWHLASHREDRRRLVAEPELMPVAVEELLRAYSPVTMAREVSVDIDFAGCPMQAGDRVLVNFPAANRDPDVFERADTVILDREQNRHLAFGVGIHRCAGSNLARMELRVALETWLSRIPEFELSDPDQVTWAGGQVRGPRTLPVLLR